MEESKGKTFRQRASALLGNRPGSERESQSINLSSPEISQMPELSETAIILLVNSPFYFLDWVLIVLMKKRYRLVISRFGEVTVDQYFEKATDAKAYFFTNYQHIAEPGVDEPMWSCAYFPVKGFLENKLEKCSPSTP